MQNMFLLRLGGMLECVSLAEQTAWAYFAHLCLRLLRLGLPALAVSGLARSPCCCCCSCLGVPGLGLPPMILVWELHACGRAFQAGWHSAASLRPGLSRCSLTRTRALLREAGPFCRMCAMATGPDWDCCHTVEIMKIRSSLHTPPPVQFAPHVRS